ncbi:MAG: type 1 glutamine amidotransferase [Chitinophagaceae bacterium]
MTFQQLRSARIAVLDLYDGHPNQGMRCINEILSKWSHEITVDATIDYFDVRRELLLPDLSYDMYISSGGPGSPLESRYEDWDIAWCQWLDEVVRWNNNPENDRKKFVFFICHSFQLACRYFNAGVVCKRRSTSFGVFPVHKLQGSTPEKVFEGLQDPFYAVDSRDYQVIQPLKSSIEEMGGSVLCIEKSRPHVPYERAVMGIRFNEYMVGTQFHPEADATGMKVYLSTDEKRQTIIENHGEEKLLDMLTHLSDPDKIVLTQAKVLPNFLTQSLLRLEPVLA